MTRFLQRRHRKLLFSGRRWRMRLVFWGGALAVGVTSVGFAAAATQASLLFHHLVIRPWIALALTPLGFMLSAWMAQRFFPGSQGSGIPQAIAARHMKDIRARDNMLSLRLTFGKIFLTLFGMACGASIGREGPTVQVGAAILLQAARIGRMMGERGLILAGLASLGLVGNYDYFGSNASMLIVTIDWVGVVVCGVFCGLIGAMFAKAALHGSRYLRR